MATSQYFNPFPGRITQEQLLLEDILIESIQQYGADVYYIVRDTQDRQDLIYGEDPIALFQNAYHMEMYVATLMGPEGQSEFFSRFGEEIRDSLRFIVARRTFQKYVPDFIRPREGDLIYVPALQNMFEIKFAEEEKFFYGLGRRPPFFYYFELLVEAYKFSNEKFRTGIKEIDDIGMDYSYTIALQLASSGAGHYDRNEIVYQGANISSATASATVKRWDRTNTVLEIVNIKGIFEEGSLIRGNTSGASFTLTQYDRKDFDSVVEEFADNKEIQEIANTIIDISETNIFGDPGE